MAVTPGTPTDDQQLFAQINQYSITPARSVLSSMVAAKYPKALQAEVNCQGYLLNKNYTRP